MSSVYPHDHGQMFIAPINHPCAGLPGLKSTSVPLEPMTKGPSTYMHAVAGKGWPYDHKAEDAFEVPPYILRDTIKLDDLRNETPEYKAEFGTDGSARLYLYQPRKLIGTFETFADAQITAKALNEAKGY